MNRKRVLHPPGETGAGNLCTWPGEEKYCVTERDPAWQADKVQRNLWGPTALVGFLKEQEP